MLYTFKPWFLSNRSTIQGSYRTMSKILLFWSYKLFQSQRHHSAREIQTKCIIRTTLYFATKILILASVQKDNRVYNKLKGKVSKSWFIKGILQVLPISISSYASYCSDIKRIFYAFYEIIIHTMSWSYTRT